jgi:predicted transcriptional regulator
MEVIQVADKVVKRSYNLPEDLHQRLERIARKEDRTLNAQVARMLERAATQYEQEEKQKESKPGQRVPTALVPART